VAKGIDYRNLNIKPVGTLPDGRTLYSAYYDATTNKVRIDPATGKTATQYMYSNFANVFELTNTDQGGSQAYTIGVRRPMKDHWEFSAFYTHTHATEVQALTSSVASSNFNYRATINPNAGAASNSYYNIPNRFVATATREFNFFHRTGAETRITAILRVQTGHAYSWIFQGDGNGDGTSGNDAFYIPSNANDPNVVWAAGTFASATAARDAFFAWLGGTDLKMRMGTIAKPNSSFNPEQQTIDLHIEQRIPLPRYEKVRLSIYLDCLNFANLLNDRWGAITGLDFGTGYSGYNRSTGVTSSYNAATNQYTYTWNPAQVSAQPPFTDMSRWQLQIGAKLEF
jgi:hypothetical protein